MDPLDSQPGPSNPRKRVLSNSDSSELLELFSTRKRTRLDAIFLPPPPPTRLLARPAPPHTPRREQQQVEIPSPSLSVDFDSSFSSIPNYPHPYATAPVPKPSVMRRSASMSSLASADAEPHYPDGSAKNHLRNSRLSIDFSLPATSDASSTDTGNIPPPMPLACSPQNIIYFTRAGNRVYYRNMITADNVAQLCRLDAEKYGDIKVLAANDSARLAIGTTKGAVQIWDTDAKKVVCRWTIKAGVACMAWHGPLLAVGGPKGSVHIYDTRLEPVAKIKEQVFRVTRHGAAVCALQWNVNGKLLASGDVSGTVCCWDMVARARTPLEVGEFVLRRRKIQHSGPITALAWCPWQPKVLATGDAGGLVRIWTIETNTTQTNAREKMELGSRVTSLHFSPNYKELVCALGPLASDPGPVEWRAYPARRVMRNAIVVHSYPKLRQIAYTQVSEEGQGAVCGSVLCTGSGAHRLVVAVPSDSKLKVFDVWGKSKDLRRQPSFLGCTIR